MNPLFFFDPWGLCADEDSWGKIYVMYFEGNAIWGLYPHLQLAVSDPNSDGCIIYSFDDGGVQFQENVNWFKLFLREFYTKSKMTGTLVDKEKLKCYRPN